MSEAIALGRFPEASKDTVSLQQAALNRAVARRAGLDADTLTLFGGIEVRRIHALVRRQPLDPARPSDVEQHAAREDPILLREHIGKREPARQRDLSGLAAVVDVLSAIDVGDGVEMR